MLRAEIRANNKRFESITHSAKTVTEVKAYMDNLRAELNKVRGSSSNQMMDSPMGQ